MLPGYASPLQTETFAARHTTLQTASFYRLTSNGLHLSSLGIGTYLGKADDETDQRYTQAVMTGVHAGINVIDTSLNYRGQRSERAIGRALLQLMSVEGIDRSALLVCTKAGYLVRGALLRNLPSEDVAGGMHSMAGVFLSDQLERSRVNLGLDVLDVFYLHNPETQLRFVTQQIFYDRVRQAFETLEKQVSAGSIRCYGVATWEGFRQAGQLSLLRMIEIAQECGGDNHHFRFIQLPFNLGMPEAFTLRNEQWDGQPATVLQVAEHFGITVVASASLLQAKLTNELPGPLSARLPGLETDAQRAIQFARSTPGIAVALAGMSRPEHVKENLGVASVPPLAPAQYNAIYDGGV